jgi:hypothetical protein
VRTVSLVAAEALFLWMFLAADSLEQLGELTAFGVATDGAVAFAASWRHGMAGNSPLYMPGFFAVAAAAWIWWDETRRSAARVYLATLAAAGSIAWLAAPLGGEHVVSAFVALVGAMPSLPVPCANPRAMVFGVYTLLTWSAFALGCRVALQRKALIPLVPVIPLTAGLVAVRPWTVDEFTTTWWNRLSDGDASAVFSLVMIPAVAALLYWFHVRQGQRGSASDHVRDSRPSRLEGIVRTGN